MRAPRRRHLARTTVAAVALALVGAALGPAQVALADDGDVPTALELLQACGTSTDVCVFHPSGAPVITAGASHQVGATLTNCGSGKSTQTVSWSETTGEQNSVGVSFINATEGGIAGALGAFKTELEVSYGHTWGTSDTETRSTDVVVEAGQKGWLTRSTPMQTVTGTYELHFGDRYYGHYYWYLPFTVTGAAPDQPDVVVQHTAAMTAQELAACG